MPSPSPFKICPACAATCHTGALECRQCGHAFRIAFNPSHGTVLPQSDPARPLSTPSPQPTKVYIAGGVVVGVILALGLCGLMLRRTTPDMRPPVSSYTQEVPSSSAQEDDAEAARQLAKDTQDYQAQIRFQQSMAAANAYRNSLNQGSAQTSAGSFTNDPAAFYRVPARPAPYLPYGFGGGVTQSPPPVVWHPNPATAVVTPKVGERINPDGTYTGGWRYNPGGKVIYR